MANSGRLNERWQLNNGIKQVLSLRQLLKKVFGDNCMSNIKVFEYGTNDLLRIENDERFDLSVTSSMKTFTYY